LDDVTVHGGINTGTATGAFSGEIRTSGNVIVGGYLGVNTSNPGTRVEILHPNQTLTSNVSGNAQAHLALMTSDAQAADKGGAVGFGGKYTDAGGVALFGAIAGRKASSTTGSTAGYLAFLTTSSASPYGLTERLRLTAAGAVLIGKTVAGSDAAGNLEVNGGLGVNGATAQGKVASGGALGTMTATLFGYGTETEAEFNALVNQVKAIRDCLVNSGQMS
jgi:hypothetical protein